VGSGHYSLATKLWQMCVAQAVDSHLALGYNTVDELVEVVFAKELASRAQHTRDPCR
jgi:hypothetical protein